MNRIRSAVSSNTWSAPIKLGLGVLQSAIIARLLLSSPEGSQALAAFAVISAGVNLCLMFLGAGTPQIFSKLMAEYTSRGDAASRGALWHFTVVSRGVGWGLLFLLFEMIRAVYPPIREVVHPALVEPVVFIACAVWLISADIGGFAGRVLSANLDQRGQNRGIILSQAVSCGFLAWAMICGSHGLHTALLAMGLMYASRCLFFMVRVARLPAALPPTWGALRAGFSVWRSSTGDYLKAACDKGAAYLLSPSVIVLIAARLFPHEVVGALFLFFDFAAKAVTLVSIPFGGLGVAILTRAFHESREAFNRAMESALAIISVAALLVAIGGTIGGALAWRELYRFIWPGDYWLVPLITTAICFEQMTLELAAASLMAQGRVGALVLRRGSVGVFSILVFAVAGIWGDFNLAVVSVCAVKFGASLVLLGSLGGGAAQWRLLTAIALLITVSPPLPSSPAFALPPPAALLLWCGAAGCVLFLARTEIRKVWAVSLPTGGIRSGLKD